MKDRAGFYQRIKHLRLTSQHLVEGLFSGSYRTVFRGPGLEFDEVREYVPGDDSRFIDWNVSSRLNSAFTKVFREEREMNLTLITDLSLSIGQGVGLMSKRETVSVLFAHLAYAAVMNSDRVGAVFFADKVLSAQRPRRGKAHASRLLQNCLDLDSRSRGTGLGPALLAAQEFVKRRGIMVVISDFRVGNYWGQMSRLSARHDVIACRVHDPIDSDFPATGYLEVVDPESGQLIQTWGRGAAFRREHHDYGTLQRLIWKRECQKRGIRVLEVGTNDDPALKLIDFFQRRIKT